MKILTLISIISLCFICGSEANDAGSTGDPNSKVVRVKNGDFQVVRSSTKWKREAAWVGGQKVENPRKIQWGDYEKKYINKLKITYRMELFRGPGSECITTLRNDRFWGILLELYSDCKDVAEYVGIKKPVKTQSKFDGNFQNVIHEISVILKDRCVTYLIDSVNGVTQESMCTGEKADFKLWVKCFPEKPNTGSRCTIEDNLQGSSEITEVKTSHFIIEETEMRKRLLNKWSSVFQVVENIHGNQKRGNKFVWYELEEYYIHGFDLIRTKLTAWDFKNKVTLIEIDNNLGKDPTEYVGLEQPSSLERKDATTSSQTDGIVHDVTVVKKGSCFRLKITVIGSEKKEPETLECDSSVPFGTTVWNKIQMCFLKYEKRDYWSVGDPSSKVEDADTWGFRIKGSTKWRREAGWVGVQNVENQEEQKITYKMELFCGPENKCITTLRSDIFDGILMEISSDCSDITEYVGIKRPVKTQHRIERHVENDRDFHEYHGFRTNHFSQSYDDFRRNHYSEREEDFLKDHDSERNEDYRRDHDSERDYDFRRNHDSERDYDFRRNHDSERDDDLRSKHDSESGDDSQTDGDLKKDGDLQKSVKFKKDADFQKDSELNKDGDMQDAIIHEIYVIFKDKCVTYLIDSVKGSDHDSCTCTGEKAPTGSELWIKK